jgi:uncharacterized RDD family membrane protein YckC
MDTDATMPPASGSAFQDASLGQRVGGLLLDLLVVMLPLFLISGLLFGDAQTGGSRFEVSLTGVPFVLTLLVALAYFVGMELTQGQTLGKRIVGTRVVSEKGELGVGPALIRNLLRVVDGFLCYAVGFFVALASKKNQRLGDMAASTRVVRAT